MRSVHDESKPLGADGDPDFGVYDAQGLIGPELNAELTCQAGSGVPHIAVG